LEISRSAFQKALKLFAIVSSSALGLVFIYSGLSKLSPVIETFEFTFVDAGIASWYAAPVFARVMIGLEFFMGFLLLINYRLRKFTIPFSASLLLLFIAYLLWQIYLHGNEGNCACFGERLHMKPRTAIYKNLLMLLASRFVYYFHSGWSFNRNRIFMFSAAFISLLLPFILNPVDFTYTSNNLAEKVGYPLQLELLYQPEDPSKVEIPRTELREGKHVLAFLSLTCSHCRIAAKKLRLIKKKNPAISIYFVLNGDRKNLPAFITDTRAENIPYSFCLGKAFVKLASTRLPRIYYLENGVVVRKVDYLELNQYDIERWMGKL
jgi:hypothetical protein